MTQLPKLGIQYYGYFLLLYNSQLELPKIIPDHSGVNWLFFWTGAGGTRTPPSREVRDALDAAQESGNFWRRWWLQVSYCELLWLNHQGWWYDRDISWCIPTFLLENWELSQAQMVLRRTNVLNEASKMQMQPTKDVIKSGKKQGTLGWKVCRLKHVETTSHTSWNAPAPTFRWIGRAFSIHKSIYYNMPQVSHKTMWYH